MSVESANAKLVRRFYDELWNQWPAWVVGDTQRFWRALGP